MNDNHKATLLTSTTDAISTDAKTVKKLYPQKPALIDLKKYMNKKLTVKFSGGREVMGILKGFDPLMNLVLDDSKEFIGDSTRTRILGLVVCRSTSLIVIYPSDGTEEIANPFQT